MITSARTLRFLTISSISPVRLPKLAGNSRAFGSVGAAAVAGAFSDGVNGAGVDGLVSADSVFGWLSAAGASFLLQAPRVRTPINSKASSRKCDEDTEWTK